MTPRLSLARSSVPRAGRAVPRWALLALALAAGVAPPAGAQDPTSSACNCGGAAGAGPATPRVGTTVTTPADSAARGRERGDAWWLTALGIPFLGLPFGGTDGTAGPVGGHGPGSSASAASFEPGAVADSGAPTAAGPNRSYAILAPATATDQPTLLLAGALLLGAGVALRRAQHRAATEAAHAASRVQRARRARSAALPRVVVAPRAVREVQPPTLVATLARSAALSTGLIASGLGCLGAVGVGLVERVVAGREVRANWEQPTAEAARASARGLGIAAVAQLEIPAIGLTRLVGEGVDERTLAGGPGHIPETVAPGRTGLSVISAHRDLDFRRLGALRLGDTVVTTTRTQRTVWRITERVVLPKESATLVPAASRPRLALTTCWPIRYFGPAPDRLLLYADLVRAEPAPAEPVRVAAAR